MANQKAARLRAVIAVADKATRPLRRIQRQFRESVVEPAALAKTKFGALSRDVGLGRVAASLQNVTRRAQALAAGATRAAGAVGLIGGGASVYGLLAMTQSYASMSAGIRDTSARLGTMADRLVGLRYAGEQGSAGAGTMDMAMQRLNRRMFDAANGKNQEVAALFKSFGIELKDSEGNIRKVSDVLPELADGFARNKDAALRTKMAFALFDSEGVALVPTLAAGRAEFEKMIAEGSRLSGMTDEMAARAGKLGDSFTRSNQALGGVRNVIADRLVPVLGPMLDKFSEWTVVNRDIVATKVAATVDRIATAVSKIDFDRLASGAGRVLDALGFLVDMVGGVENALIGVVLLAFAPAISQVGMFALSLGGLGFNLARFAVNTAIVGRGFVGLAGKTQLVTGAVGLMRTAFVGLSAFFAATPLGVAMAAVGALAGAVYLIYRNWDAVVRYVSWFARAVAGIVTGPVDVVAGLFSGDLHRAVSGAVDIFDGLVAMWRLPLDLAAGLVRGIVGEIDGLFGTSLAPSLDRFMAAFDTVPTMWRVPVNAAIRVVQRLGALVSSLVDGDFAQVSARLSGVFDSLAALWRVPFDMAMAVVRSVAAGVDAVFSTTLSAGVDRFLSAFDSVPSAWRIPIDAAEAVIRSAGTVLSGLIDGDFAAVASDLAGVFDAVAGLWRVPIDMMLNVARSLAVGIDAEFGTSLTSTVDGVAGLFEAVAGRITDALGGLRDFIAGVVENISGYLNGDLTAATAGADKAFGGLARLARNSFRAIRAIVVGVVRLFRVEWGDKLGRLIDRVGERFGKLIEPFRKMRSVVASVFSKLGIGDDEETDDEAPAPASRSRRRSLPKAAAAAAAAPTVAATTAALREVRMDGQPGAAGKVDVKVDFTNLPRGARTQTRSEGGGIRLDTGVSMAGIGDAQ